MVYHNSRAIVSIALLVVLLLAPLLASVPVYAAEQEVSMSASGLEPLGYWESRSEPGVWCRLGQRLHINGTVLKIGYRVVRAGNPSGNIIFSIYDAMTDEVLFSEVWGDASQLTTADTAGYQSVVVSPAFKLNRDVRLCVEYCGGNETDHCHAGYYSGDKITGQSYTNYRCDGQWHDIGEAEEGSYYLSYIPADASPDTNGSGNDNGNSFPWGLVATMAGLAAAGGGILYFEVKRRRHK